MSASSLVMRCQSSLSFKLPATTARVPSRSAKADSSRSSLSFALRSFLEGPWQWKQLLERMGRTSRLNFTLDAPVDLVPTRLNAANNEIIANLCIGPPSIHTVSSRRKHFLWAKQLFVEDLYKK